MECEMYHYGKPYNAKEKLVKAINDWIYYYMYERYQRRFGVKTPYEANPYLYKCQINIQYLKNKRIIKYKLKHYTSSTILAV